MITKDELERLKQPSNKNAELRYTIGGPVEAAVHSSVESERIGAFNRGHRTMHKAVSEFRNEMGLKPREGLARAQFTQSQNIPARDRPIAEKTWQQNHHNIHEKKLNDASNTLKIETKKAFNTDAKPPRQSKPVREFAAAMQARPQSRER